MPKRGRIAAVACEACRKRKGRCDGARPTCSPCQAKGALCVYTSAPNLSRFAALKAENEELRSRHGKLTNLCERLIYGTAEEVTSTLERIRSEGVISSLLEDEKSPSRSEDDKRSVGYDVRPTDVREPPHSHPASQTEREAFSRSYAHRQSFPAATSSRTEKSSVKLRWLGPWKAAALTPSPQQSAQPPQNDSCATTLFGNSATVATVNSGALPSHQDGYNDRVRARSGRPTVAPSIDRLAMGRICPFNTIFDKPEAQWAADTAGDFDNCIQQAFSILGLSDDTLPYGRPKGNQLVIDMHYDNLLLRVAGLVAGAAFPGCLGYRPSTRPFLCYFRFSVLGELHRRIFMETMPTRSLVAIVTLLAGWEWAYGDPGACGIHLQALQRMALQKRSEDASACDTSQFSNTSLEPVQASSLPPGLAFLARQRLLPDGILDLIGPTVNLDMSDARNRSTVIHLGTTTLGIRPRGLAALEAHRDGHVGSYVATCCRVAAGMYHTLMMTLTIEDFWHSAFMDVMEPMYAELAYIPLWELLGTVYDEVLVWCLCTYYIMVGHLDDHHLQAFHKLLKSFDITRTRDSWRTLRSLMERYVYHRTMDLRLIGMLENEEVHVKAVDS